MKHLQAAIFATSDYLYRLTLALLIGGTVMFILFAPILFSVLPDAVANGRQLSGVVVSKTLPFIQWGGLAGGALLLLLGLALYASREATWRRVARAVGAALIATSAAASLFLVTPRMETLRADMGVIDAVPLDDPRRVEFNSLHKRSSTVHLVGLLAALALLGLTTPRRDPIPPAP